MSDSKTPTKITVDLAVLPALREWASLKNVNLTVAINRLAAERLVEEGLLSEEDLPELREKRGGVRAASVKYLQQAKHLRNFWQLLNAGRDPRTEGIDLEAVAVAMGTTLQEVEEIINQRIK